MVWIKPQHVKNVVHVKTKNAKFIARSDSGNLAIFTNTVAG